MSTAKKILNDLKKQATPQRAKILARYFKTGKGEYGEGDIFFGLTSAQIGEVAKKYHDLPLVEIQKLLNQKFHECRTTALAILVKQFKKTGKKEIVDFYLKNTARINNWDLVDISAPKILGLYLIDKNRKVLYRLAKSKNLWERRIAIISTFAFIDINDFTDSLKIAETLLCDKHDLIHKAVGWALREIGKKDQSVEEKFLKKHYRTMPRTMLRYAIEKFDEKKRQFYLKKD